VTVTDLVVT